MNIFEAPQPSSTMVVKAKKSAPTQEWANDSLASIKQNFIDPRTYRDQRCLQNGPVSAANEHAKDVLRNFERLLPQTMNVNLELMHLMLQAVRQTAVSSFEPESVEIFAQDGYTMDVHGGIQARTFVYSENLRYHISHHATSFRTALGMIWMRKTVVHFPDSKTGQSKESQCVTSFVFYPTTWLQRMGIQNGLEAILASAGRSWIFNCRLTFTRAVPENSLIFELCRTGQTRAVETLFSKGLGSVVDTSPKGWKPLHVSSVHHHESGPHVMNTNAGFSLPQPVATLTFAQC
jgi:hypothetical protein